MVVEVDIKRVIKKPADLEERIKQLEKQKEILKAACRKAGEINKLHQELNEKLKKRA